MLMNFIWIVGSPAVGKMAVARKIAEKTRIIERVKEW